MQQANTLSWQASNADLTTYRHVFLSSHTGVFPASVVRRTQNADCTSAAAQQGLVRRRSCRGMPAHPDWASLAPELWQAVYLQAGGPGRATSAREAQEAWVAWIRLLATGAAVCKALRSALVGAQASQLWENVGFRSSYAGLSQVSVRSCAAAGEPCTPASALQEASRGLNRFLIRHGHHARRAHVYGGERCPAPELHDALASLTHPALVLEVRDIDSPSLAECTRTALQNSSLWHMRLMGSVAPSFFPCRLKSLSICDTFVVFNAHQGADEFERRMLAEVEEQHASQAHLQSLQHLQQLEHLSLYVPLWQIRQADIGLLSSRLPRLRVFGLFLAASPGLSHAADALHTLAQRVQLQLTVAHIAGEVTTLLQKLRGVQLHRLQLRTATFTAADEHALAQCTARELTLEFFQDPGRRLQQLPQGVKVTYGALNWMILDGV